MNTGNSLGCDRSTPKRLSILFTAAVLSHVFITTHTRAHIHSSDTQEKRRWDHKFCFILLLYCCCCCCKWGSSSHLPQSQNETVVAEGPRLWRRRRKRLHWPRGSRPSRPAATLTLLPPPKAFFFSFSLVFFSFPSHKFLFFLFLHLLLFLALSRAQRAFAPPFAGHCHVVRARGTTSRVHRPHLQLHGHGLLRLVDHDYELIKYVDSAIGKKLWRLTALK